MVEESTLALSNPVGDGSPHLLGFVELQEFGVLLSMVLLDVLD